MNMKRDLLGQIHLKMKSPPIQIASVHLPNPRNKPVIQTDLVLTLQHQSGRTLQFLDASKLDACKADKLTYISTWPWGNLKVR